MNLISLVHYTHHCDSCTVIQGCDVRTMLVLPHPDCWFTQQSAVEDDWRLCFLLSLSSDSSRRMIYFVVQCTMSNCSSEHSYKGRWKRQMFLSAPVSVLQMACMFSSRKKAEFWWNLPPEPSVWKWRLMEYISSAISSTGDLVMVHSECIGSRCYSVIVGHVFSLRLFSHFTVLTLWTICGSGLIAELDSLLFSAINFCGILRGCGRNMQRLQCIFCTHLYTVDSLQANCQENHYLWWPIGLPFHFC